MKKSSRPGSSSIRGPLMQALEPRIMFDAAVAATVAENTHSDAHSDVAITPPAAVAPDHHELVAAAAAIAEPVNQRQEIVFIDTSIANYDSLLNDINPAAEVVFINADQDGLQVIADTLAGRSGIDAIHILSHGDTGKIQLGNDWIDSTDVAANAELLASIGGSLSETGDILLYGCHVGADGAGIDFIQSLATTTGADIAASNDATGAIDKGGDWVLEATQGSVETVSLDIGSYSGLLAAFTDNFTTNPGTTGDSFNRTLGGVSYTYTFTGNGDGGAAGGGLAFGPYGSGGSAAMTLLSSTFNTGTTERVTITRTDLVDFTFTSIYIDNPALNESVTVGGYLNGALVGSSQVFTTGTTTLNFGGILVDEVRITATDFYGLAIDDFTGDTNPPNTAPVISNLNGDSVAWAGVGNTVVLDASANASLTDTELDTANNWNGASLTVQRSTAIAADNFGFNTSGALFSVSGTSASGNLQSGGLTFATYTNTGGVLTISFNNSGTTPTTALVNDVARHINYQNDTPAGDATIRFTLNDGTVAGTVANVTVTTDSIYVTNTTDTATINVANGVSFSEAVAIAAADATGSQTIVFSSSLAATALTVNSVSLNESLTFNMDAASGMSLTTGTITLGAATIQTFTNGAADTANISSAISGSGALTKAGAGTLTLSGSNNFSGATTISAGTLAASGGSAIGDSSNVSVASGAIFSLSSSESTGNLSGAGTINLGSNTLTSTITANTTFSGDINGTGGLTVSQSGAANFSLTLSGANTYTGNTIAVNFGWLKLNGDASVSGSSQLRANGNSIITLQSDQTLGSLFSNNANASIQLGSFTLSAGGDNTSTTVSGVISGTGHLVKQGSGTLTLSGINTYGGTTTVSAGTLSIASDSNLGSDNVTLASGTALDITGATNIDNAIALGGDATISNSANATLSGVISGANTLSKAGASTLTLSGTNTYAATTVSAGTLSIASDANLGSGAVTLATGSTLAITGATNIDNGIVLSGNATVSNSANATLSGVVSGANTLSKTGASTLTLSGTNTHTGAINVSAGGLTLQGGNSIDNASAVTVSSGTTLTLGLGNETIGSLAGSGNVVLSYRLTTGGDNSNTTFSGVISGSGNGITKNGNGTFTLSGTNTYTGSTAVNAGTLLLNGGAAIGDSSAVTVASGATLSLGASETLASLAGAGNVSLSSFTLTAGSNNTSTTFSGVLSGSGELSKSGSGTLTLSGSNSSTFSGTTSVIGGALSVASDDNMSSGNVTLAAGTTLFVTGATTIDNAITLSGAATVNTAADATLSGNIGGAGSLAKAGANTLTLSGTNGYAGTTTVSAGTLSIASDGNLGSNTVTLATGTTLAVTGATIIDNAIALSGNATVQVANAVTLDGAISGGGGLSKTGAGILTLSGSNGFTGNVAVSAGGLTLSNGAAIDNNSAITMSSGTTLTLSSSETIGSLAGAGSVALGTNTLTAGGDNTSTSYSGNISGTGGGIIKTGAGTFTLSGSNSNTGATTISAGTIDSQNGDAIGNASAVSVASGAFLVLSAAETIGSLAGAGTAALGVNTLTTGGNNTSTTFSGAITGSNGMIKTGSGTLTLSNTGNESTLTGGMTISAGTVSISDDDHMADGTLTLNGGTLSLDGPTVFDNNIDLAASSTINSGGNAVVSGVISGAGDLTKTGSLSLQLVNNNTYTGDTIVSAGYLLANNANSLGTTAGDTTVASGGTLYLSGSFTLDEALNLTGTGMSGNGAIYAPSGSSTITGLVTLRGNTTIVQDGDLTFSGGITDGAGSYSLTKQGTGALTLSGTASYDGTTTISSGGLSIGSDSHLGSGALTLATGTALAVTGATTIDNAIALSGGTVTVNNSANTAFSGNITGAGGLTKTGASTLTLLGTDSYTGATNVNAGSLLVNGALTATSNATVASGATVGGSGSISSNVTVNSGGTLSPGNSAGALTVNGDLMMASGSTLVVEINGATAGTGYDQVIVNGTVDVSGATLSATHGYVAGSGDTYNIIVNDAADAVTGSFSGISEGATMTAGGNSTVLTASYIGATGNDITLTAPIMPVVTGVSSSTPNGTYKIGDTISVEVTFDMAVFVSGGTPTLLLETGTVDRTLNYVSGSGSTTLVFDYTVQAGDLSADLDYASTGALVLNGSTIQDALNLNANLTLASPGAANSLGANKALVVDGVVPTASIVVADTALAASETSLITITFSEAVTGLAAGDFTVENGALSGLSTSDGGITWTATLTPDTSVEDTNNLITLNNTGVIDAAGNTGSGTTDSNNYALDTLRPTASIVVADTALAAGETSTVTITFNEAVTGLADGDFTVANGVLSGLITGDGGITWTATLTPDTNAEDTANLITLDNTGVIDAAGNTGSGTTDSNNYAVDTLRPTASIVVADTALAASETSLVTITFSEAVTGVAAGDFTVANGVLSGISTSDGGITWTGTLTPTTSIENTTNMISLDNTGVIDAAGNTGSGTTDSNNYAIDTLRPTASIVVADTALAVGETSTVTITFSEAVTGLAAGDFIVANGALSGLSTSDGGITWTATLTPDTSTTDTANLITLDNTGVIDAAGNAGSGTTDSNNYAIDTLRPTVSIVVADTALAAGETSLVTITFNEAVTGLAIGNFTVANGLLSGLSSSNGGVTWTATLTPTTSIENTTNVISLNNTSVQDAAGNTGTGTTDSNNYSIDTQRPTASIVVADTALAVGETSLVTITLSEAVASFDNADLTIANGTLSNAVTSDGGITWTATLTPTASIENTTNVITLDNTGVVDAGGNTGTGTTDSNNYAIDTLRPTASIVVADTALAIGETSTVTITFSEAVTGFNNADLTVENGTLSTLSSADGGITWTATFTPTTGVSDTTNLISLDNTGVQDAAGNTGTGTTDSNNYGIDNAGPTVTVLIADTALAAGETSLVTFTFSEAVTGFNNADLTIDNGTLTTVSSVDGGITWTATFTPTISVTDTANLIVLNNTGVTDSAGNAGTGTTNSNNYAIDTTPPTATIVVADTALTAGETSLVTITMSEAVTNFDNADLTVTNGTLSTVVTSDGGITWTATLTPSANVTNSSNVITLANNGFVDSAGNSGTGTTDSNAYSLDTSRPTANIVIADTALAIGETSLVTVTFSEAVTGFTNADVSVANGTLDTLVSDDGGITWLATFTPTANITDTINVITLDNSGVSDEANNTGMGITESNNIVIDTTAPTVTSVSVPANGTYIAGQHLDFTVNLSEAVTVDNSTGIPRIAVTLDTGGTVYANYLSGSGTNALVFRVPIISGQLDTTGIALGTSIEANGGTLRDSVGNAAVPALNVIAPTTGVLVDAITPTVSIQLNGSPTAVTQSLSYNVVFSEAVQHVDVTDFSLATTGSTNASIGGLRQIDDHTWLVTVDKISGSGTVRLDVKASNDITDSIGNSVSGALTGTSFITQMLPPVTAPTITAPLVTSVTETPVQTNTVAPLIVLSADASQVGGATNNTSLTTVEAPLLITSMPSFTSGSSITTSLDTSSPGNDPIGIATATSTGTISGAPAMSRLANGSTYAPAGPGNSPTIDRLNSTQDGALQGLQATGKVDVQSGAPLYIPLPNTTSTNPNEQLSVDVRMVDGKPLAPWLKFDPVTGTLTGQAPRGFEGKLAIQITVRDSKGNTVSNVIELNFTKDSAQDKPIKTTPEKAKPGAQLMGKPGLNDQFAQLSQAQYGQRAPHAETDALLKALNQISVVPESARRA